jgi:hypothetical protein
VAARGSITALSKHAFQAEGRPRRAAPTVRSEMFVPFCGYSALGIMWPSGVMIAL